MPVPLDYVIYSYDDERDGQIAVGSVTSPWMKTDGFSTVSYAFAFAGGTTAVDIEMSGNGAAVDQTIAGITSGGSSNVIWPYMRFKITQTVATTTNAELSAKAVD